MTAADAPTESDLERAHERAAPNAARVLLKRRQEILRRQVIQLTEWRTDDPAAEASRNGDLRPSFRYKLGEQRRRASRLLHDFDLLEPVQQADAKLDGREFAERLGVRVPDLLAGPIPITELDFAALPDHFVLKPTGGHSSRGVFLLHRVGRDAYASLLDQGELFTSNELLTRYGQWLERGTIPNRVIVEQLVHGGPPDRPTPPIDWRLFCFYGEVGFVMARDGHGYRAGSRVRFRFFDDEWNDLGIVRLDVRHDSEIEVPMQATGMIEAARRLSEAIPRSMVRIDLYDAPDAIYFGEVTPFPGGNFTMADAYDRRFGAQWECAEARLERDAIEAGVRNLRDLDIELPR